MVMFVSAEVCDDGAATADGERHDPAWDGRKDTDILCAGGGGLGEVLPAVAGPDHARRRAGVSAASDSGAETGVEYLQDCRVRAALLVSHHPGTRHGRLPHSRPAPALEVAPDLESRRGAADPRG